MRRAVPFLVTRGAVLVLAPAALAGNDTVNARGGSDFLFGQAGADADTVSGGDGNDQLWAGPGADMVAGGLGSDQIWAGDDDASVDAVDCGDGLDRAVIRPGDTAVNCEVVTTLTPPPPPPGGGTS